MKKIKFYAPIEYVTGYLTDGHWEGEVYLTDEEFNCFKNNPIKAFKELKLTRHSALVVDDIEIEDYGDIISVEWEEVEEGDK